jgi:hypothetical protein
VKQQQQQRTTRFHFFFAGSISMDGVAVEKVLRGAKKDCSGVNQISVV